MIRNISFNPTSLNDKVDPLPVRPLQTATTNYRTVKIQGDFTKIHPKMYHEDMKSIQIPAQNSISIKRGLPRLRRKRLIDLDFYEL